MFAGLSALPMPTDAVGRMWRLGDMLREYRGDAHIAAAAAAGFDGCDLQVLTERCAGDAAAVVRRRSRVGTRPSSTATEQRLAGSRSARRRAADHRPGSRRERRWRRRPTGSARR